MLQIDEREPADGEELTAVGLTFERTTNGLRTWLALQPAWIGAAAELLIWHESWLRRQDFLTDVTWYAPDDGGVVGIRWSKVEAFLEPGPRASSSQLSVLRAVLDLGTDRYGIGGLGHSHRQALADAFAAATVNT